MSITLVSSWFPATAAFNGHTLWGLAPTQLHDRYWETQGVHVVRSLDAADLPAAGLFLLTDDDIWTLFNLRQVPTKTESWGTWVLRLQDSRPGGYREVVRTDEQHRFMRLERQYDQTQVRCARAMVTRNRALALLWQQTNRGEISWRQFRRLARRRSSKVLSVPAAIYRRENPQDVQRMVCDLAAQWDRPCDGFPTVRQVAPGIWCDQRSRIDPGAVLVGPVWIGAHRRINTAQLITGPTILWDAPLAERAAANTLYTDHVVPPRFRGTISEPVGKRLFDILFALAVLALTLPFYPLIMLAIWWEDGRPFFFTHPRETRGPREFPCLKFRSMRKNADVVKAQLAKLNRADGPQFFMENDPRLTRVGAFLRKTNIDELPQFCNVLLGHMSVVGPRPSPRRENQYCPPWREARLSVRPGVVGLWQICRTRQPGLDFQEWIRFDVEYVKRQSWRLDLWIIWRTILLLLLQRKPTLEPHD